jgi:hypothetical protein
MMRSPSAPQGGQAAPQVTVTVQPDGSLTVRDVEGLRAKLAALREELQDAASRRRTVADQLSEADSRALPGLQNRLNVLDDRIVALEKDITATGRQLAAAPPALLAETAEPDARDAIDIANKVADDIVPLVALLSVLVLAPITLAFSRFLWNRGTSARQRAVAAHAAQASDHRIEQLQQSVDAIAIEVERIAEGQRFVTKMMSDRALGGGAAEPIRAQQKSSVPSER